MSDIIEYNSAEEAFLASDRWDSPIHSIRHVIEVNGKFRIMGHINCDDCEFCGEEAVTEINGVELRYWISGPHLEKQ